jgi:hypothetical protein
MRNLCGAIAVVMTVACAPDPRAPVNVVVLAWVPTDQKYEPAQVQLLTVDNLTAAEGEAATFVGGAQIVINPCDPSYQAATTLAQLQAAILKSPGGGVSLDFTASNNVYFANDFHSWNIITAYYNFEQAYLFYCGTACLPGSPFPGLGLTPDQVTPAPDVYYFPLYLEGSGAAQIQELDSAAYVPLLQGFVILPFVQLQSIPLSMNLGVMAHEYTHSMVDLRAFDHNQIDIYSQWETAGMLSYPDLLISFDEGNADVMGGIVACGPNGDRCDSQFIGRSFPQSAAARDLAGCHCYDKANDSDILTLMSSATSLDEWKTSGDQYVIGSWFSSAVWTAMGGSSGVAPPMANLQAISEASWSWLSTGDPNNPGLKELIDASTTGGPAIVFSNVLDAYVRQIQDATLRQNVCAEILDHFNSALDAVPATCMGVAPATDCESCPTP